MQLLRTHKIGLHSSKPSHAYPIIRLPREFHGLVGSNVEIYQTVHEGALVFLVKIVERARKSSARAQIRKTSLYTAKVGRSNRLEPIRSFSHRERELSRKTTVTTTITNPTTPNDAKANVNAISESTRV
jgi:hypothetical protein